MFQRGRLDHFALNATSEASFRELRNRLIAEGCDDCVIIDMGVLYYWSTLLIQTMENTKWLVEARRHTWWHTKGRLAYIEDY